MPFAFDLEGTPLFARFAWLQSQDPDETREAVSRVFCEHRLSLVPGQRALNAQVRFRRGGSLGYGRMRYGATVDIDPGQLDDFYLLQMPLQGAETIVLGRKEALSVPGVASLVSPGVDFRMRHEGNAEKLFLRVELAALERAYAAWYGEPLRERLVFESTLDLHQSPYASLRALLQWHCVEASDGQLFDHPLLATQAAETLILALLQIWPHASPRPVVEPAPAPLYVRRAEEYLEGHAHLPLTMADVADHVGVSARSLYAGFRQYRCTSPLQYLRDIRLQRVHAELQTPMPDLRVTDVALRWGFSHLGQFAAAYRRRYGEPPSATLRRCAQRAG